MSQVMLSALLEKKGSEIYSVEPAVSVFDAIQKMSDKGVGALLVVEGGALRGIVSERDYTRKVILRGRASKETPVSEIMTRDVVAVSPDSTVDAAMRLMSEKRIRHLPVVDGGSVVGVVSIGDLVKAVISAQKETIEQLQHYIGGGYMA